MSRITSLNEILGEIDASFSPKPPVKATLEQPKIEADEAFTSYLTQTLESSLQDAEHEAENKFSSPPFNDIDLATVQAIRLEDHLRIANVMPELGRYEQAQARIGLALQLVGGAAKERYEPDLYVEIASTQAKAGFFDDANKTLEKINMGHDKRRAYMAISSAQAEKEMIDDAKESFRLALQSLDDEETNLNYEAHSYIEIGDAQVKQELYDDAKESFELALKAANRYGPGPRLRAKLRIAAVQTKRGHYNEAIAVVEKIDASYRSGTYAKIASAQAQAGMLDEAKSTIDLALQSAEKIMDEHNKSELHKTKGEYARARVYAEIASAQAQADMLDEAKSTISLALESAEKVHVDWLNIEPRMSKMLMSMAYEDIASAQLEAKLYSEAFETTKKMEDFSVRFKVCSDIVSLQLKEGMYSDALEITKTLPDNTESKALMALVQTQMGRYDDAIKTTGSMFNTNEKIESYIGIATAQAQAGMLDEAKSTIGLALESAGKPGPSKVGLYLKVTSSCHNLLENLKAA